MSWVLDDVGVGVTWVWVLGDVGVEIGRAHV